MAYRTTRRSKLTPILFTLVILAALAWWLVGIPLSNAREAWAAGDYAAAEAELDKGSRFHLRPADYEHLYAAVLLSAGDDSGARPYLDSLAQREADFLSPISKSEVAERLVREGRYQALIDYDTMVDERRSAPDLAMYRAAALAGTGDLDSARSTFATLDEGSLPKERYSTLQRAIDQREEGTYPLLLDREGGVIASWNSGNNDLVAVDTSFLPLVDRVGGAASIEANLDFSTVVGQIRTTLDPSIQRAARDALGSRRGSIVVIDPETHEILAMASSKGDGEEQNLALGATYEAASVIKVLTSVQALQSDIDLAALFPIQCQGFSVIDGRQFFDWARHGTVAGLDEAMAVSCNVAFGAMALELGAPRIIPWLKSVGFGTSVDLGLMRTGLGTLVGDPLTDFQTANLGIGLDHYRINTIHLAMIGDMLANRGVWTPPVLISKRYSILGDELPAARPQIGTRVADQEAVERTLQAMKAVVENDRGTGRGARVEGLEYSMKTGTSGSRPFDALIVAVVPTENPAMVVSLIGEGVGPAEHEGARIMHSFLEKVRGRF